MTHTKLCKEIELPQSAVFNFGFYNNVKNSVTNWEFKTASDEDIDWKDIKNSLSYKEPLALITRTFGDGSTLQFIAIHKKLMKKAFQTGYHELAPSTSDEYIKNVYLIDGNFSDWVDWAKAVKAEKWPNAVKSTFKVILPTI